MRVSLRCYVSVTALLSIQFSPKRWATSISSVARVARRTRTTFLIESMSAQLMAQIGFRFMSVLIKHLDLSGRRIIMTKISVELDWETIDNIVVGQLLDTWKTLRTDLGGNNHVFVWGDQEADDIEIQKHIDALELILKWYANPEQLKDLGLND
jgi:hypothetical protein